MASIPFSDTTNKNGIIQLVEFTCGLGDGAISNDATLLKRVTALANQSLSEVWHLLFKYNGGWKFDNSNYTNLNQATQDLVAGTSKYALPDEALTIERIEVKDNTGMWHKLSPFTLREVNGSIAELLDTDGTPSHYRAVGRTIELFPAPAAANVTTTAGLKVFFDRGMSTFSSSDTSKTPGFSTEYHDLVPTKTSIKLLRIIKPDSLTLTSLLNEEIKREAQLAEFEIEKFLDRKPLYVTGANNHSR